MEWLSNISTLYFKIIQRLTDEFDRQDVLSEWLTVANVLKDQGPLRFVVTKIPDQYSVQVKYCFEVLMSVQEEMSPHKTDQISKTKRKI
jgi:hypothetical protein